MPPMTSVQNIPRFATASPSTRLRNDGITTTRSDTSVRTNGTVVAKPTPVKKPFAGPHQSVVDVTELAAPAASAGLATPRRPAAAVPNNETLTPGRQSKSYDGLTASVRNRMCAMEQAKKPTVGSCSPDSPSKRTPKPPLWYVRTSPSNRTPKFHVSMKSGRILKLDRARVPMSSVVAPNAAATSSLDTTRNSSAACSTTKAAPIRVEDEVPPTIVNQDPTATNEATATAEPPRTVVVAEPTTSSLAKASKQIRGDDGKVTLHRPHGHNADNSSDSQPSDDLGVAPVVDDVHDAPGPTGGGESTGAIAVKASTIELRQFASASATTSETYVPLRVSSTNLPTTDADAVPNATTKSTLVSDAMDISSASITTSGQSLNLWALANTILDSHTTTKYFTREAIAAWAASVTTGEEPEDNSNKDGQNQSTSDDPGRGTSTILNPADAGSDISRFTQPNSVSKDLAADNSNTATPSSSSTRTPAHISRNTSRTLSNTPAAADEGINETIKAMRNMRARVSVKKLNDVSSSWALKQKTNLFFP